MSPVVVAWMALAGLLWAHSAGSIFAIIKTDLSEPAACFLEEGREGANIWHLAPVQVSHSRSNRSATEPRVPSLADLGISTFDPYRVVSMAL